MTKETRIEKAINFIENHIETEEPVRSLLLYEEDIETLTQLLKGNIKELKIRDFKKMWKDYEEPVQKIMEIINNSTLTEDQKKISLQEYFKEEDHYCWENCSNQAIDDYWGDVKAMKECALDIFNTEDYDFPSEDYEF